MLGVAGLLAGLGGSASAVERGGDPARGNRQGREGHFGCGCGQPHRTALDEEARDRLRERLENLTEEQRAQKSVWNFGGAWLNGGATALARTAAMRIRGEAVMEITVWATASTPSRPAGPR